MPRKCHGWRNLVGYSPQGRKESDMTERLHSLSLTHSKGFPGAAVVKNPPANAGNTGDAGSVPGSARSPGGGNGNLFQYSCLENSMNRGAW